MEQVKNPSDRNIGQGDKGNIRKEYSSGIRQSPILYVIDVAPRDLNSKADSARDQSQHHD